MRLLFALLLGLITIGAISGCSSIPGNAQYVSPWEN